jgi:hypothetical protein
MRIKSSLTVLAILLASAAQAQQPKKGIVAEGGSPDERASARVLYWDRDADRAAGQIAINYGRPVWKKDYEDVAKFDGMTDGKVWRMGSNFWTNLVTDLPLNIAGKDVSPGVYYLGLHRSADGSKWSLAFIDPAGARKEHLDAFDIRKATVEFMAAMSTDKAETTADKLTITMSYPKDDFKNVTMKVAWGNLALSAPIKVTVGK